MGKFLNKYYKDLKDHDDEKFKFITYPNVVENMYVVSNYGKIINFKTNNVLTPFIHKKYYRIRLKMVYNKNGVNVSVHRLVCWEYCKHKKRM